MLKWRMLKTINAKDFQTDEFSFLTPEHVEIYTSDKPNIILEPIEIFLNGDELRNEYTINISKDYCGDYLAATDDYANYDELNLLSCLKEICDNGKLKSKLDIVCFNEFLTYVSTFPYLRRYIKPNIYKYSVIKLNGCLFIWYVQTEPNVISKSGMKGIFCDRRFTTLMTTVSGESENDLIRTKKMFLNTTRKIESKNCQFNIFFAKRVDCKDENGNFVDIKTRIKSKEGIFDRDTKKYNYLRWWAQNYFTGVDRLIIGVKDGHYNITKKHDWKVDELPGKAYYNNEKLWEKEKCVNFLGYFFQELNKFTQNFDENSICVVEFNHGTLNVEFSKTTKEASSDFPPDWFIEFWKSRNNHE